MKKFLIIFYLITIPLLAFEQVFSPTSMGLNKLEYAQWVSPSDISGQEAGVYLFRKSFEIEKEIDSFIVHVSADNRYILYINGKRICDGPARGDIANWQFESVDVTSVIQKGENVIAAVVWNCGDLKPYAQIIKQTGFFMQGELNNDPVVYTDDSWKVIENKAFTFFHDRSIPQFPFGGGPGEKIVFPQYPTGWNNINFDDKSWPAATVIRPEKDEDFWHLVPRIIPFMEERLLRIPKIRRSSGGEVHDGFLTGEKDLVVPANKKVKILLDQTFLRITYPVLHFSKGKDSKISITYNESLFDQKGRKGHRDEIDGKELFGLVDILYPDGGLNQIYRPLWYRAYRYVQIEVETKDDPLILHDFYCYQTGYPFQENASFVCDDPAIQKIWDTCWRTVKACAHETYMDCPFYEQLQYVGDTRVQGLISYTISGDTRLIRQAIDQFYNSILPSGLTYRSYPSVGELSIPPFSLIWISMIYDYWMQTGDTSIIVKYLDGIEGVINWFSQYLQDGLLTELPDDSWDESKNWQFEYWTYVDDTPGWQYGVPFGVWGGGQPAAVTLSFAYGLMHASKLMHTIDKPDLSKKYAHLLESIKKGVYKTCWDKKRKILADTPEKKHFSQHVNVLAVLIDMFPKDKQQAVMTRIIKDPPEVKCSIYYRYYMHRALHKAGLGDRYLEMLDLWYQMLNMGYTTFPEHEYMEARSDCHAWGSHPMIDFFRIICGVNNMEPGYTFVRIEPFLGKLKHVRGSMPHPLGLINVEYEKQDGKLKAEIKLPYGLEGIFVYDGKEVVLKSGLNII